MKKILRIGTRTSPLALIQAQITRDALFLGNPEMENFCKIEIVPMSTSGDWIPGSRDQSFLEIGGNKGLFTKELEEALYKGTIDFAVHSMKDVSIFVPEGLEFAAVLERANPRDAFLSPIAPVLEDLPEGARVGTSSLRRMAQTLAKRPDLKVVPLRGNVDTRLRKLAEGEAEATILAVAGLQRLGVMDRAASIMDTNTMLPAAAQGALGVEIRSNDDDARKLLAPINSAQTLACVTAERALLKVLDGSCRTPIAALAQFTKEGRIELEALTAKRDGSEIVRMKKEGAAENSEMIGKELGEEIKNRLSADFFNSL